MITESVRTRLRASSRKCQVSPTLTQGLTLHFHYKRVPRSDNYRNVVVGASAPLAHSSGRRAAFPPNILRRQDVLCASTFSHPSAPLRVRARFAATIGQMKK